ncbi:MAG: flagellar biosynthesis protein FlhA [Pseudomonadota bacterium]
MNALTQVRSFIAQGVAIPVALITIMVLMVVPVPTLVLDLLFTFNIALGLLVLMITVYSTRPLDFGVFPSLLLIATLLRLSLNIASTRIVLMNGHNGDAAAGQVIQAFGNFVAGGNYTVGFVVFVILVLINFVVVTKGAGRVSEVSARFTLDAMPGKQMAIDADLNAGLLDQEQARARRQEIAQEADFYGSMDGASKFVRGDAIAGVFILLINLIGGIVIGATTHDLDLGTALQRYGLLTIGDGLAAQLPSLLLSTATAILVTRASAPSSMGEQFSNQVLGSSQSMFVVAGILAILGLIPGMPTMVFLVLALAVCGAAWQTRRQRARQAIEAEKASEPEPVPPAELSWDDIERPDILGIEVGYKLIPLLDSGKGGPLLSRIKGIRKKLSKELGFLIQPVHIRDNLELAPSAYRVRVLGVPVAEAEIIHDRHFAINPGDATLPIEGVAARDPAFNLDGYWIDASRVQEVQALGYTVVDAPTVIATHLSRIIFDHASNLIGFEEAQMLLDRLAEHAPKLAEDLVPGALPMFVVVKVLKNLLAERVAIKDMRTIAEALTENAPSSQDPGALTEAVRAALGRAICQKINGLEPELDLITLETNLERILLESITGGAAGSAAPEPELTEKLQTMIRSAAENQERKGQPAVLVVSPALRQWMSRLLRPVMPSLHVLSFQEIPDDKRIRIVTNIGSAQAALGAGA